MMEKERKKTWVIVRIIECGKIVEVVLSINTVPSAERESEKPVRDKVLFSSRPTLRRKGFTDFSDVEQDVKVTEVMTREHIKLRPVCFKDADTYHTKR